MDSDWYAEMKKKKKILGENTKVIKERTRETKSAS